ncbi:hypothetical protein BH11BAC4_BH11BAC4_25620 [soil metagenome]
MPEINAKTGKVLVDFVPVINSFFSFGGVAHLYCIYLSIDLAESPSIQHQVQAFSQILDKRIFFR